MVQTEAEGFYVTQDVKGDAASQQPEKNNREFDGCKQIIYYGKSWRESNSKTCYYARFQFVSLTIISKEQQ